MKKFIVLSALFFVAGITAFTRNEERLDQAWEEMERLWANYEEPWVAENKLLQTEAGKAYEKAKSDWEICTDENGSDSSICAGIHATLELALAKLQETTEYQKEYLPALNRSVHYYMKRNCLLAARHFAATKTIRGFKSEKEAILAGVDSFEGASKKPSKIHLRSSSDLTEIEKAVKREVREFIEENMN